MKRAGSRYRAVCCLILLGWGVVVVSAHSAWRKQNARSLHVLEKTVSGLLERAHRLKDDLALQATIASVSQAPGVAVAAVIGEDGKILAHTDPAQIGQILKHVRHDASLVSDRLDDRGVPWGTVVFRVSPAAERQTARRIGWLFFSVIAGMLMGVSYLHKIWAQECQRLLEQTQNQEALRAIQEEKIQMLEQERQRSERVLKSWIQDLVEKLPDPEVLLDPQQRILAMNSRARERLESSENFVESSWHEIPTLAECGAMLQQSLERPGQPAQADIHGAVIRFYTAPERPFGTRITWVK